MLLVLIALFIIAYKILQVVVQTMIVAVLSGVFVGVLSYMGLGPEITIRTIFFFMSLGVALFIGFSVLDMATDVLSVLWSIGKNGFNTVRSIVGTLTSKIGSSGKETHDTPDTSTKKKKDEDSKEKSIILKEADDE